MDDDKVNIGGDAHDTHHRYRMPRLVAKAEGGGNGKKTRITNLGAIAKKLYCSGAYPTKYFGLELGTQAVWDEKAQDAMINGPYSAATLQKLLEGFIHRFILCPGCKKPEMDMLLDRGRLFGNCLSCHFYGAIGGSHKLTGYIVKHPPVIRVRIKASRETPGLEARKSDDDADNEEGFGDVDSLVDVGGALPADGPDDDVTWHADTSEGAVLARQRDAIGGNELLARLSAGQASRDILETEAALRAWFAEGTRAAPEISEELARLKEAGGHTAIQMLGVLLDTLWDGSVVESFAAYLPVYQKYVDGEKAQKVVLGSIERFCGVTRPDLVKRAPHIIKAFYEADLLDEDCILRWADRGSSKYVDATVAQAVKKAAAPLIDWLRTAEAEDGDESDDSASPEEGTGAAPAPAPRSDAGKAPGPAPAKAKEAIAEEELNVDDI